MDPLTLGLIFGGLGLGKSIGLDMPRERRDRKLAAETQRYSPWTHMTAPPIRDANPLGDVLQFGTTGVGLANAQGNYDADQKLKSAYTTALNAGRAPSLSLGANSWNFGGGGNSRVPNNAWGNSTQYPSFQAF